MMKRKVPLVLAALAATASIWAFPVAAQDSVGKPAVVSGERLSQALVKLSTADGFEIRGLERVGDETVQPPKSGSTAQILRRLLRGYSYTVELVAADPAGKAPAKLTRVNILGHASDVAGDLAQTSESAPGQASADAGGPSTASTADGTAPNHPVNHMLQTLAQASIPVVPPAADSTGKSAAVSASSTGASASAPASSGGLDPVNNPADMATLTHTASVNLSALVQSLKTACPAGAKC
jgi:hypothetical protein